MKACDLQQLGQQQQEQQQRYYSKTKKKITRKLLV